MDRRRATQATAVAPRPTAHANMHAVSLPLVRPFWVTSPSLMPQKYRTADPTPTHLPTQVPLLGLRLDGAVAAPFGIPGLLSQALLHVGETCTAIDSPPLTPDTCLIPA
jgi:hypothetical protein